VERDGSGNATAITSPFGIRVPVHRWSLVAYSLDDLMDRGRLPVLVLWSGMVDLSSSTHLAVVLVWQILLIVRRLPLD